MIMGKAETYFYMSQTNKTLSPTTTEKLKRKSV